MAFFNVNDEEEEAPLPTMEGGPSSSAQLEESLENEENTALDELNLILEGLEVEDNESPTNEISPLKNAYTKPPSSEKEPSPGFQRFLDNEESQEIESQEREDYSSKDEIEFDDIDALLASLDEEDEEERLNSNSSTKNENSEPEKPQTPSGWAEVDEEEDGGEYNWDDEENEEEEDLSYMEDEELHEESPAFNNSLSKKASKEENQQEDTKEEGGDFEKTSIKDRLAKKTKLPKISTAGFGEKFEEFKAKVMAELKGEDSSKVSKPTVNTKKNPSAESSADEESSFLNIAEGEEEDSSSPDLNRKERKGSSKGNRGGAKNIFNRILTLLFFVPNLLRRLKLGFLITLFFKIFNPIKNLYLFIANTLFNALEWTLKLFSKLPLIGKPFSWILQFTKIIRMFATSIPIVLILIIWVMMNKTDIAPSNTVALPDEGSVTISSMKYEDNGTVTATISNTGGVIVTVQPTFQIYSTSWWSPLSYLKPTVSTTCVAKDTNLQIGQTRKIIATCKAPASGINPRVSGNATLQD